MSVRSWVAGAVLLAATTVQASPLAYVPGSGFSGSTLTVIDTATDTVVTSLPVFRFAQGAAVSPDGTKVYLSSIAEDYVPVLDALTNTISGSVPLTPFPGGSPVTVAVNSAGTRLYAAAGAARVTIVDLTTNSVIADLSAPGIIDNPSGVTVTPDGAKAYATNVFGGSYVVAIDTTTNTIVQTIPNAGSRAIDSHPDSSKVYAADSEGFPTGVTVIDTAADTVITKISIFPAPWALRVHPDGTRVYAHGYGVLSVIDTATNAVVNSVPALTSGTYGMDINPAGTKLYLPDYAGKVDVYDANSLAFITSIPVAGEAFARGRFIGPAFACGNGTHEPGEACDDGNLTNGDCCSSTCTLEACDDGNACTVDSCVAPTGCVFAPRTGCKTAEKSILLIKDKSDNSKDKLLWKWIKGESTDRSEFGEPTTTADYTLCLFAGTAATLIEDASVPPDNTKWAAAGTKGYKYKDGAGEAEGIQKMLLKSSDQNKAKALVMGKGANLPDPPALDTLAPPILVQLINDEPSACWKSTFESSQIIKQDPDQLKAKAQN